MLRRRGLWERGSCRAVSRRAALTRGGFGVVLGAGLLSASTGIAAAQPAAACQKRVDHPGRTGRATADTQPDRHLLGTQDRHRRLRDRLRAGLAERLRQCGTGSSADLKSMFIATCMPTTSSTTTVLPQRRRQRHVDAPPLRILRTRPAGGLPPAGRQPDHPPSRPATRHRGLAATTAALQQALPTPSNIFIGTTASPTSPR